jgi:copper chaperone NosL
MMLRTRLIQCLVAASSVLITACSEKVLVPVEIEPSDMCAFCKMAISEKRYAAEFIDKQGEACKFDDFGCLRNYAHSKQMSQSDAAWFAIDFQTKQWLNAEHASIVQSTQFKTPMNGRMVALGERTRAEQLASQTEGIVMTFAEVFGMAP